MDATCPGAGDSLDVEVSQKSGGWKKAFSGGEAGHKVYSIDLDKIMAQNSVGRYDYAVKIALKGKAVLNKLHVRSWFQHNAMAAPHLMPGANVVKVEARQPGGLAKGAADADLSLPRRAEMDRRHPKYPAHRQEEWGDLPRGSGSKRKVAAECRPDPTLW